MNRSKLADRPPDSMIYLTGCSNASTREVGRRRADLGAMVTPLIPGYIAHAADYRAGFGVDNGAFSKSVPFDPDAFRGLVKIVAGSAELRRNCLFVTAPDVVGDPFETRRRFRTWGPELRATGLPVAYVLQDGCEKFDGVGGLFDAGVPWGEFDVLFVGGSTDWKCGVPGPDLNVHDWIKTFRTADELGIPVHCGRVNSFKRMFHMSYGAGCRSSDGTLLAFGTDVHLPKVEVWLDKINRHQGEPSRG